MYEMKCDVAIIGGGPAGLSADQYDAGRVNRKRAGCGILKAEIRQPAFDFTGNL